MKKLPLEKEVEAAFFDFVKQDYFQWKSVARQVKMPLGIIDILGFAWYGGASIVEVKRGKIDRKAVGQLIGYIGQMDRIIEMITAKRLGGTDFSHIETEHETVGYLVGKTIDREAESACKALGITVYLYEYENGQFVFNQHFKFDEYLVAGITESDCSQDALTVANLVVEKMERYAADEILLKPPLKTDTQHPQETLFNNKFITIKSKGNVQ